MSPARKTRLSMTCPTDLLLQLGGHVDPADLACVDPDFQMADGSFRTVHMHTLCKFVSASASKGEAVTLLACCKRLIELGAPVPDAPGDGVAVQLSSHQWSMREPTPDLMAELADCYIGAGLWDIEKPTSGQMVSREDLYKIKGVYSKGVKPLASALIVGNVHLVRFLCERGASLELGEVFAGAAPMNAVDLATELGGCEALAIVAATAMQRHIDADEHRAESRPFAASPRARRVGL